MKKIISVLLCGIVISACHAAVFLKADATGSNDGTSWENAFTSFADAVRAATSYDDPVYVATGIYPVAEVITVESDLQIIGGFDGTETEFSEPDAEENKVIITGDTLGDDYWSASYPVKNNYGKVWNGNVFNEPTPNEIDLSWSNYGKTSNNTTNCLVIAAGSPVGRVFLKGLTFTCFYNNAIRFEGEAKLVVDSCKFLANGRNKNTYTYFALRSFGETCVSNCIFVGNDRAMQLSSSAVSEHRNIISHCEFRKNASQYNSACVTISTCNALVTDCLFEDNVQWMDGYYAGGAAAVRFALNGDFLGEVENCIFRSNHVRETALGVVCLRTNYTKVYFKNCLFEDNTLVESNADIHQDMPRSAAIACGRNTTLRMDDCLFLRNRLTASTAKNTPFAWGAAIGLSGDTGAILKNTTFLENSAINTADAAITNAVGTIGIHGNYYSAPAISLINCALIDNVTEGEYTAEFSALYQVGQGASKNPHIALYNTIIKNESPDFRPFYLGNTTDFPAYKVMANSIVDKLDTTLFETDSYSFEYDCFIDVDPKLREGLISSPTKVSQVSLRAISPFAKSGIPVWEAPNGKCYWYDDNFPNTPWRNVNGRKTVAASVDGIDLDSPIIPDAFGRERKFGKISLGPLNANSDLTIMIVK